MIKNRAGDVFEYGSQKYVIGDLRDGEDKDTDNETPDIYCNFELPVLETERADLEERFSRLYNDYKTCDDIFWGDVIMAPEMIRPLYDNKSTWNCRYLYLIIEESSDPDSGCSHRAAGPFHNGQCLSAQRRRHSLRSPHRWR